MKAEDKNNYSIRLDDASEFLETAEDAFSKGRFKAAVMNAGDAAIAANDAFTIYLLGQKASRDHMEAFSLHKLAGEKISENKGDILRSLLEHRHADGYRCTFVSKAIAEKAVKDAVKFVAWVQSKISA